MSKAQSPQPTSTSSSLSDRLRQLILDEKILQLPGCYDVLSGIAIQRTGFSSVFLSGYGAAASYLGNPDIGLTTATETSRLTQNLAHALDIPILVDADDGYGHIDNVRRTVWELEQSGAAGIILEDQAAPKRCGHTNQKRVLPLDETLAKLTAALEARRSGLVVVARTDAPNLKEAIERANAFGEAGADMVLIDGVPNEQVLLHVATTVPWPKAVNLIHGGKTPLLPAQRLEQLGFAAVIYSTPALFAAFRAVSDAMETLHQSGELGRLSPKSVSFDAFQSFILSEHQRRTSAGRIVPTNRDEQPSPVRASVTPR